MNAPESIIAQRRANTERLLKRFAQLQESEGATVENATELFAYLFTSILPRLHGYAMEADTVKVSAQFTVDLDLTPGAQRIFIRGSSVPPPCTLEGSKLIPAP